MPTREAMRLAVDAGLDLVEVSPNAEPPVCRIMDFGKYRYDESQRKKQARKSQPRTVVKEVKFRVNVDENDYQVKMRNVRNFLAEGHKVKLTLQFRGRENAHRELGHAVIERVIEDVAEIAVVEQAPRLMGRAINALIGTKSQK